MGILNGIHYRAVEDSTFLCLVQDNFLTQHVLEPTRAARVLYICKLLSRPNRVCFSVKREFILISVTISPSGGPQCATDRDVNNVERSCQADTPSRLSNRSSVCQALVPLAVQPNCELIHFSGRTILDGKSSDN